MASIDNSTLMWVSVILIVVGLLIILYKLRDSQDYKTRAGGLAVATVGLLLGVYVGYNTN